MAIKEIFINNLKYFRKQKGMNQNELTLALDKGYNYINGIEQGRSFPPPETIDQIAEILGIEPSQLFDKNGSPENVKKNSRKEFVDEVATEFENRIGGLIRREVRSLLGQS